jgi:hypothetical protein
MSPLGYHVIILFVSSGTSAASFMCGTNIVLVKHSLMNGVTIDNWQVHRISCTAIESRHGRWWTAQHSLVLVPGRICSSQWGLHSLGWFCFAQANAQCARSLLIRQRMADNSLWQAATILYEQLDCNCSVGILSQPHLSLCLCKRAFPMKLSFHCSLSACICNADAQHVSILGEK